MTASAKICPADFDPIVAEDYRLVEILRAGHGRPSRQTLPGQTGSRRSGTAVLRPSGRVGLRACRGMPGEGRRASGLARTRENRRGGPIGV